MTTAIAHMPVAAQDVRAAVDRGLQIREKIERLQAELALIENALKVAGLAGEQVDLVDPDRDGRQFLAAGTVHTVPVVFTADLIAGSFVDGGAAHLRAEAAAQGKLAEFYRKKTIWELTSKSGKAFRREAAAILGDAAPEFVTACLSRDKQGIPKSAIKVEWDRAEARN